MREDGEPIPDPTTVAVSVEIPAAWNPAQCERETDF